MADEKITRTKRTRPASDMEVSPDKKAATDRKTYEAKENEKAKQKEQCKLRKAMWKQERRDHPTLSLQETTHPISLHMRRIVVSWLSEVCFEYGFSRTTFHQSIHLFDRFLALQHPCQSSLSIAAPEKPRGAPEKTDDKEEKDDTDDKDGKAEKQDKAQTLSLDLESLTWDELLLPASPRSPLSTPASVSSASSSNSTDSEASTYSPSVPTIQCEWDSDDEFEDERYIMELTEKDPEHYVPRGPINPLLPRIFKENLQLVAFTAMFIAQKNEEILSEPKLTIMLRSCDGQYNALQARCMERIMLGELKFRIHSDCLIPVWLSLYFETFQAQNPQQADIQESYNLLMAVLDIAMMDTFVLCFYPSALAAAAFHIFFFWNQRKTGRTKEQFVAIVNYDIQTLLSALFYVKYIAHLRGKQSPENVYAPRSRFGNEAFKLRAAEQRNCHIHQKCLQDIARQIDDTLRSQILQITNQDQYDDLCRKLLI